MALSGCLSQKENEPPAITEKMASGGSLVLRFFLGL